MGESQTPTDLILAIDIGSQEFLAGLITLRGRVIDWDRHEVEVDVGPQSHFAGLASIVTNQLEHAETRHDARVVAIGVGCSGQVEGNCDAVTPIRLPAWRSFPLRSHLSDLTGLPVYGAHAATALALGEGWRGAAKGLSSFAAISVSTGIGGAFVVDGELVEGNSGHAGDVGHIIVEPGGRRCSCGARGCLASEASGLAIEQITGRPPTEPSYDIMTRTGRLVGRAAGMICSTLDLDLVVIGGGVALGFAATFFNAAQQELDRVSRVGLGTAPRVTPARLGFHGDLIGAGAVGIRGMRRDPAVVSRPRVEPESASSTEE